ncbi:hypothetical protein CK203_066395 [Vitis vinifera]|uniref:Uncharacterized protein n=1 Tax=Vitis vinifera TaxID=29760 RepID=A0A438FNJ1_VITVI|nr:hypothetical protein CK203_066395 [Vitis vinifera]
MQLKEELTLIQCGNREKSLVFEELHDLLAGHESYLQRMEVATQQMAKAQPANPMATNVMDVAPTMGLANPITTRNVTCCVQFCEQMGHTAKHCLNSSPKISQSTV